MDAKYRLAMTSLTGNNISMIDSTLHAPVHITNLWKQILDAHSIGLYSLSIMGCRKMLMTIAVQKANSDPTNKFKEHLAQIRSKELCSHLLHEYLSKLVEMGNEENHQIRQGSHEESEFTIDICARLLGQIYLPPKQQKKKK